MAKVFAPWMDAEIVHHIMTALDDNTLELYLKRVEEGAASITFNWHYKTNSSIYVPPAKGKTSADTTQMWSDFFDVKPKGVPAHRAIAEAINFHRSKTPNEDTTMTTTVAPVTIENVTYVTVDGNRVDVSKISVETIFSYIEKAEAEIERLNKLKARPKALERRIEELTNGIQALVAAADAREAA